MRLADLVPADYNPRDITDDALAGLGSVIDRYGLVQPVVWNKRSGNIVGGHQRMKVLLKQGVEEATVAVVDLNDKDEKALNIALNNPHISGDFTDGLQALLRSINDEDARLLTDLHLDKLLDEVPDDTDWGKMLGADGGGEQPLVMQRAFVLSMAQCEALDNAMAIATANGLDQDPDNQNKNGNALHAIVCGFLLWAEPSQ